jgi:hypothetical protein
MSFPDTFYPFEEKSQLLGQYRHRTYVRVYWAKGFWTTYVEINGNRRCYHEKNAAVVDCIDTVGRVCRG